MKRLNTIFGSVLIWILVGVLAGGCQPYDPGSQIWVLWQEPVQLSSEAEARREETVSLVLLEGKVNSDKPEAIKWAADMLDRLSRDLKREKFDIKAVSHLAEKNEKETDNVLRTLEKTSSRYAIVLDVAEFVQFSGEKGPNAWVARLRVHIYAHTGQRVGQLRLDVATDWPDTLATQSPRAARYIAAQIGHALQPKDPQEDSP